MNYSQVRESMNYGFVFNGPQLQYGRSWQWNKEFVRYQLESQLGIGLLSEKGSCYDFHLSPIHFNFLVNLDRQLGIGPCFISDYNYEFYPDLQAGHGFWFSTYSAGICLDFRKSFTKRILFVKCQSTLFGFTSRTPDDFDALFFDIGFKDAMRDLHKDMRLTAFNAYQVIHIEAGFTSLKTQRIHLSCLVDYKNYRPDPDWTRLDIGIKLTIHSKPGRL